MTDSADDVGRKNRNEYARKWQANRYATDPEYRAARLARQQARYAKLSQDPEWREKQADRASTQRKERYASDPEYKKQVSDRGREWRAKVGPSWRRANRLMRDYGLTLEAYDAMHRAQFGACAICTRISDDWLHVDHVHVPGYAKMSHADKAKHVRGLLCAPCNSGIARLGEDPVVLRAAADFLEAAQRKQR